MNIAIFSDTYTPFKNGVTTSINQLKEAMEKIGHTVIIVTVYVPGHEDKEKNVYRVWSMPSGVSAEDRFAGIVNQRKVMRYLKSFDIDLIHVHSEFSVGYAGRKIAKRMNLPLVATTHTMWEEYRHYMGPWFTRGMARAFLRFSLKKVDAVVCPSIKAKKYINKLMPEKLTRVIPNGIDMDKFITEEINDQILASMREKYQIAPEKKVLLFVGRIAKEKRVNELIGAIKPILEQRKDVILLLVGAGPDFESTKQLVKNLGIEEKVRFTGFVNWSEVYKLYNVADILLSASLSEVHPMTAIEGAICGLPSIVRRDDSFVDLVHPGENGYLVDTDEEMTQKVLELIDNAEKLALFSKKSREISKEFSAQNHVNKMIAYYQEILDAYPNMENVKR